MQRVERVKLKSGLEVVFLFDKNFTTSTIQMCFKLGWRADTENERGLAHLFEHLIGKRTQKYPNKSEFAKKIDREGIVSNAYTGPDMTVYYQNQTNDNLMKSLELFYEAIYNTLFTEEDLEKEKGIVLNEADRYLDNDSSLLWMQVMKNLFPKTTMEKFFFGDKETMKNITLKHFEDFYKIYRNPKNSILFIGTKDKKVKVKTLKFLNSFYADKDNKKLFSNAKIPTFLDKQNKIIREAKISKPDRKLSALRLVYRTPKISERENVVASVISDLLTGGLTGKLMEVLRDDMGLVYGIGGLSGEYAQGINYIGLGTSCDKDKKELVIGTIKQVLKSFPKTVTQEDIKNVIPTREYNVQKPISVTGSMDNLIDAVFYKYKYIQRGEYIKILKRVTVEDVKKLMKKTFVDENSTLCILE